MKRAVRPLLADATQRLRAAGVDTPRVDAELLLATLLGVPRSRLLTLDDLPHFLADDFERRVEQRAARRPLQHITGKAPFRHLTLAVGPGVFIPRPETELLVDAVLPHLRTLESPLVVDLCSGSGALALAVATEVPGSRVLAVEASDTALRWLRRNTAGTDVDVVAGDVRDAGLLRPWHGRVDAVVCNPPYVPLGADVSPEVLADPHEAVFAGPDGLDLLSRVISQAGVLLRTDGVFAVEHDDAHGAAVPALLAADGRWTGVADHDDLAGRPRYATARRSIGADAAR